MHMKGGDSRRPITALAVCVELLCCFYIPNKNRSEKTSHTPYFPIQNSISLGKASEFGSKKLLHLPFNKDFKNPKCIRFI